MEYNDFNKIFKIFIKYKFNYKISDSDYINHRHYFNINWNNRCLFSIYIYKDYDGGYIYYNYKTYEFSTITNFIQIIEQIFKETKERLISSYYPSEAIYDSMILELYGI